MSEIEKGAREFEKMKKVYEEAESLREFRRITGVSLGKPSNSPFDDPNFEANLENSKSMFNNTTFITYSDYSDATDDFEEKEKLRKSKQTSK